MSKLESGLFVMTPVDVQLATVARDAVKMFEGEARSSGIDLVLRLEESLIQLKDINVSLDPTRVMQVLIVSFITSNCRLHSHQSLQQGHWRIFSQMQSNSRGSRPYVISRSVSACHMSDLSITWTQFMVR